MALLRRNTLYAAITLFLIYFLWSCSFPYESSSKPSPYAPNRQSKPQKKPRPIKDQKYRSFDWEKVPIRNKIASAIPLPTGEPQELPKVQFDFPEESKADQSERKARQDDVRRQFLKCWWSYRSRAWLHDEIRPISGDSTDHFGGWAATLIDALDTLWIMGFAEEFNSAVEDVELIDFGYTALGEVNVFETNIRHLGGLLSAYELSKDERLLYKAKEVGDMLYHAFDTPNHMPITRWDFRGGGEGHTQVADDRVLLAEIGSMSLEFTRLSQLTGDPKFYDVVARITRTMVQQQDKTKLPGMFPIIVNGKTADFTQDNTFTLNSMADSTYEYFPKMYALLGGQEPAYRKLYEKSMDAAMKYAIFRVSMPENENLLASGHVRVEGDRAIIIPELQHLSCYTGGMFALGGKLFNNKEHQRTAEKLTNTCIWAYKASKAGVMPEVSQLLKCPNTNVCQWDEEAWHKQIVNKATTNKEMGAERLIQDLRLAPGFTSIEDRRYILRPEAIESVFIMYRTTGERSWQDAAWDMFTAIMRNTDTDLGNAALQDVTVDAPPKMDSMESFWMAETLKYFFLIFAEPYEISLDEYVFNTEAHPFKIPKPGPKHGWADEKKF